MKTGWWWTVQWVSLLAYSTSADVFSGVASHVAPPESVSHLSDGGGLPVVATADRVSIQTLDDSVAFVEFDHDAAQIFSIPMKQHAVVDSE